MGWCPLTSFTSELLLVKSDSPHQSGDELKQLAKPLSVSMTLIAKSMNGSWMKKAKMDGELQPSKWLLGAYLGMYPKVRICRPLQHMRLGC